MPRPRRCRRVYCKPNADYFKPDGVGLRDLKESVLAVDEFEAVRLKDLLNMPQELAAKKMNISQPTFHRLVLTARRKIADAIVNCKAIKIRGGNFKMMKGKGFGGPPTNCICVNCGHKEQKERGVPCSCIRCPKCSCSMTRA